MRKPKVLMFATQGAGGNEENRMRQFLAEFDPIVWPYPRVSRHKNFWKLLRVIKDERPDIVVMEGSGLPGGLAILCSRWFRGIPFAFSSGDAVGPYLGLKHPVIGWVGKQYEKLLYRNCRGFIGWTPYLVGRALTFGARRCMTAPGFAPFANASNEAANVRTRYNIPQDAIVYGIAVALIWNPRRQFCYGMELVQAIRKLSKPGVAALIIGDGTGLPHLKEVAGDLLGKSIFFTGRLPQSELPACFAAMDFGSLPQSLDQVGSFRFTTKVSEYLACNLPVITGQTPFAYDYGEDWIIRLPGDTPWDPVYITALKELMETTTRERVTELRKIIPGSLPLFDLRPQQARMQQFIRDLCQ